MELKHIELGQLTPDKHNVRKRGGKACDDLIPSIRSLGIIQPLLVRPSDEEGRYDIVAGQRRYHALNKIAETDHVDPVPCLVMEHSDDASAIEASLAENIARLPMDEIDQYKAFAALIGQGHTVDEITVMFGVTERMVKQRLAIANLIAPILTAYRKGDINADTVRILTMASKQRQKDWYALFRDDDQYAPFGRQLKAWLFGGADIPTKNALFDLQGYGGTITADLFGDESYFDDVQLFWELQNQAIAEAKQNYLDAGWNAVIIQDIGEMWCSWDMGKRAKSKGGKVFVEIGHDGEVTFHEGYITSDEARRLDKEATSGSKENPANHAPELTKAAQNYLALHRHAAVRADLLTHQGLALRIAVAQIIAGSDLWDVKPDPQKAAKPEIAESLATNKAEARFQAERQAIAAMLDLADEPEGDEDDTSCDETESAARHKAQTVVQRYSSWEMSRDPDAILAKLMTLDDDAVTRILTFVVAECLPCGTSWVEAAGMAMQTDMSACWTPDQTFLELVRDKNTLNLLIGQVAGKDTADAHVTATGKLQRQILSNCIKGERTTQNGAWDLPYLQFPMKDYTDQFGIEAIDKWLEVKHHYEA